MRLNELDLVNRLQKLAATGRRAGRGGLRLRQGIGDDCAVAASDGSYDQLITTDLFIEDVHFRRSWQSARAVGHKVLARGLSDIAAMGGTARLAFLSLALPRSTTQKWIDDFLDGFLGLARLHNVVLAGGDTGSSPQGFMADIIAVGEVPRGAAVLRSGARRGDEIWVSGRLGSAAAELRALRAKGKPLHRGAANAYFYPQPRLKVGEYLRRRKLASAMMDITDGLSIDLFRLTKASRVGAVVDQALIPRDGDVLLEEALHGGDDFELLFTVPRRKAGLVPAAIGGVPLARIGRISAQRKLLLEGETGPQPLPVQGYQHF